jgi:hypothetical protein
MYFNIFLKWKDGWVILTTEKIYSKNEGQMDFLKCKYELVLQIYIIWQKRITKVKYLNNRKVSSRVPLSRVLLVLTWKNYTIMKRTTFWLQDWIRELVHKTQWVLNIDGASSSFLQAITFPHCYHYFNRLL